MPVRAAGRQSPRRARGPAASTGAGWTAADTRLHLRSVVLGEGIAKQYGYLPGETRTIRLNGDQLRRGRRPGSGRRSIPTLDNAAFVTQWAAKHVLGTNGQPNQLYIRAVPGTTQATANAIPTAISLGGLRPGRRPRSRAMCSRRRRRPTRRCSRWRSLPGSWRSPSAGSGSPTSCRSRSSNGRRRSASAGPWVTADRRSGRSSSSSRCSSGVLGGLIGACSGSGSSMPSRPSPDGWWSSPTRDIPIWMGLALLVSVVAGLYPSIKAARLEPLETLRLG